MIVWSSVYSVVEFQGFMISSPSERLGDVVSCPPLPSASTHFVQFAVWWEEGDRGGTVLGWLDRSRLARPQQLLSVKKKTKAQSSKACCFLAGPDFGYVRLGSIWIFAICKINTVCCCEDLLKAQRKKNTCIKTFLILLETPWERMLQF